MTGRIWAMILALLLLSGCGRGSEDFTVRIARPADRVIEVLGHAELDGRIASYFPGLKLERTRPTSNEVLYTMPGDGSFPAVIHLTFESANGDTVVHAAVDVPSVKVALEGKNKVISEFKVERALKELIETVRTKLEAGNDTAVPQKDLSQLLTALAIVTDTRQVKLAQEIQRNPESYMDTYGWLYDGDEKDSDITQRNDAPAPAWGQPVPGDDPNAAVRAQSYKDKERTEDASAPMDEARGDGTSGEE